MPPATSRILSKVFILLVYWKVPAYSLRGLLSHSLPFNHSFYHNYRTLPE